jgi:hypothetical protein
MIRGGAPGIIASLPSDLAPAISELFITFATAPGWTGEHAVRVDITPDGISLPSGGINAGTTGAWTWLNFSGVRYTPQS